MKQKFPFTPAGVASKISTLYGEDDASINTEANATETDLFGWVLANFNLEQSQVDYMYSLGNTFAHDTGKTLAFYFRNRYPVRMEKGDKQARGYKFIRKDEKKTVTYAPEQETVVADELLFYIS